MSSSSTTSEPSSPGLGPLFLPEHIVVLVHGNNGAPSDFDSVERVLMQKYRRDEMLVIKSRVNHQQTSLGVDVGGEKLAKEIVTEILKYDLHPSVETYKFSIVGHSLGGLYSRYAIVEVQRELSILNMEYVSFVTLCTPHLGSRRPRAESTFKNVWRYGVHTVLASKSLYGQTGVDLLVSNDPQQIADVDPWKRPIIAEMSDPDCDYISALRRFRYCTLVAMADGDVVVPFASASIRNYNPYPSNLLTKRYSQWRWHIRHRGFHCCVREMLTRLDDCVDHEFETDDPDAGLDVSNGKRFSSVAEYDCDNKREVEFTFDLIENQQKAVPWRRIDVVVEPSGVKGKLRLHDWPINKMQQPDCRAMEFIELLCDVIGTDHQLELRPCLMPSSVEASYPSDASELEATFQDEEEERPSRLSLTKWAEKKDIGGQIGTIFQNIKMRLVSVKDSGNVCESMGTQRTSESSSALQSPRSEMSLAPEDGLGSNRSISGGTVPTANAASMPVLQSSLEGVRV